MNKEIIKGMNKKEKKRTFRKWWYKNGYKINRAIFFPIWFCMVLKEKTQKYLNSRTSWSEERAEEILTYYIAHKAEWTEEEKIFYFFDNGFGWSKNIEKKYLKRKDRRFWDKYKFQLRRYLIDNFELDGFTKEKGECCDGWTELYFKLIEEQ